MERKFEGFEQSTAVLVVRGGRRDGDIHPANLVDLVVLNLGENDLLLDAQAVVAAPVEGARPDAAEVADARDRDVDQPVEELVHAGAAQGHLAPDRLAIAPLEGCDR